MSGPAPTVSQMHVGGKPTNQGFSAADLKGGSSAKQSAGAGSGGAGMVQGGTSDPKGCAPNSGAMFVKKANPNQGFSAADLKGGKSDRETGSGMNRDRTDKHAVADEHNFGDMRAGLKKTGGPKTMDIRAKS